MTSNETGKDVGAAGKPLGGSAPKAAKPSDTARELTDEEIAAVAGGATVKSPVRPPTKSE